jgi:hypothetical protein
LRAPPHHIAERVVAFLAGISKIGWLVAGQVIVQQRFTIRSGIISKWRALSVATP